MKLTFKVFCVMTFDVFVEFYIEDCSYMFTVYFLIVIKRGEGKHKILHFSFHNKSKIGEKS